MRPHTDISKVQALMAALGQRVRGRGRVYFTGGTCALIYRWRTTTIDIDLKASPEPEGFFEAIAALKEEMNVNIELAAPDQFIPALPGWDDRSVFIARHGNIDFYHYDFFSQALAKLERGHERDLSDVEGMLKDQLVTRNRLWELFQRIEPQLIRYPSITPALFREKVAAFCSSVPSSES